MSPTQFKEILDALHDTREAIKISHGVSSVSEDAFAADFLTDNHPATLALNTLDKLGHVLTAIYETEWARTA